MLEKKVKYKDKIGIVKEIYNRDGIEFLTILCPDVEINWVEKKLVKIIEDVEKNFIEKIISKIKKKIISGLKCLLKILEK